MTEMADAKKTLFEPKLSDFQRYDFDHPEVWHQFRTITFDLMNKGITHYRAKAVFEIIRYHRIVKHGEVEFEVNANLIAYYVQKFLQRYPQHKGFFEVAETLKGFVERESKLATDILDVPDVKNCQSSGFHILRNHTKRFTAAAERALTQIKRGRKDKENV